MMKKFFSIILTAVTLLLTLSTVSFAADKSAKLSVDSVNAKPGETVSVSIRVVNNPGIVSANINVAFDEGLALIGATNGSAFPKSMSFIPPKQLSTVGKITGNCNFAWQGVDIAKNDIKDGVILTLRFKVSENARSGDVYGITVTSRSLDIVDKNLQCIKLNTAQGKVSIDANQQNQNNNVFSSFIKNITDWIRRFFMKIKQLLSIQ